MCWVADAPPMASSEPAAWREPEDDMDMRELAPGDAKYEEVDEEAVLEVRRPTAVKAESSVELNVTPLIEVEVEFAFIVRMYFSAEILASGHIVGLVQKRITHP
jgi:hypothetical protein